jgi:hypothetical protein
MFQGHLGRWDNPSDRKINILERSDDGNLIHASVLPEVPAAWILNMGLAVRAALPLGGLVPAEGGVAINVSFSKEGSSSERASLSHED